MTWIVILLETVKFCARHFHVVPFSSNEFHKNTLRKVRALLLDINNFILMNSTVIDRFR